VSIASSYEEAFVILRADLFHRADVPLETRITAKEVVRSLEVAQREVTRLNALHPDGQVRYWAARSRLLPSGSSSSSDEPPA
jgi:hypothetical protein